MASDTVTFDNNFKVVGTVFKMLSNSPLRNNDL